MKIKLKQAQYWFFWLLAWLPLTLPAADIATAAAVVSSAPDFAFTEPEFETMHDAEAIDNRTVTALAQDARGLIWIGTQNGLVRYDGYRFRRFVNRAADPFSLAADYVTALSFDKDGRLWVGTISNGISVFDSAKDRFEHFRHNEKVAESLGDDQIFALAGDKQGGIWVATKRGLDYQPLGSKGFLHFRHSSNPHSLLTDKVNTLLLDRAGRLWAGTREGLQRLAPDGKRFITIIEGKSIQTLFEAQDGKLWLGAFEHGAAWVDAADQVHWLPLEQLSHPWISGIAQINPNQIWLGTGGGGMIMVAASDGQVLKNLRHDPTLAGSLVFNTRTTLMVDRAGWLWVGFWAGGLQRMNTHNTLLRTIRHSIHRKNGLSHPDVLSILELADGRLAIGTSGNGIDLFYRQKGLIGGYRRNPGQANSLPDATIHSLAQSSDGAIWAGTQQAGVLRQLAGSSEWVPAQGLLNKTVRALLATSDGSLWAGTNEGGGRWQADPKQPQTPAQTALPVRFEILADEHGKPLQDPINSMTEDQQGRVWLGTNNGLWLHQLGHRGLIHITADAKRPDGLVSNYITGLLSDSRGNLWIAAGTGLERLKSIEGNLARFEHVGEMLEKQGIDFGGNLLEDLQGRIWSESSIIERLPNGTIRAYMTGLTPADGIDPKTHWSGSYARTRDGLLLFGGTQGLMIIDPAHFKPYVYAPPLVVSELKINGKIVAPGVLANPLAQTGLGKAASLLLEPEQRNFAIEFAALDYGEPKKNRYQYRLQAYDKDWINTDSEHRSATYGNLWPGLYTLQVRGSNRQGEWSPHELAIPIRVLPAWWQTWWFGVVLVLVMSSLVAALVQTRTRYLRQRQRVLEQLVDERTSELRQKQGELVDANNELNESNNALNESNEALNEANADLVLSVETLRQLGDIGREITANLDAEIVFQSLYLYVGGLLNAPTMTIYRMNAAATALDAVFGRDDGQVMPMRSISLDSPTSNAVRVVRERQELLLRFDPLDNANHIPGTRQMLTALFAPLIVDNTILGVMSIQSDRENAYGERECLIFRTLSAYGAIALANAAALAALRHAQGQLVQQEKMASLGGLVAGIAHEINTPLGTTLVAISGAEGAWQTLQNAVANGSLSKSILESSTTEGMEYTALALKTASRAAELIALFKTISVNADSDRLVKIELADYLHEVATLVRTQLVQNGCKLEVFAPAGLSIQVVADALTETLSRILVNVLNHAFTDGRIGTLRLSAEVGAFDDGNDEVVITIADDGHGIAKEDLRKVFDPFFTTKSGLHGHVGLGLHVAYNHITQRLKGKIHVASTLGEGTCVEIRLKKFNEQCVT